MIVIVVGGGSACGGGASGNNGGWGFCLFRFILLDNARSLVVVAIPFMPMEVIIMGNADL